MATEKLSFEKKGLHYVCVLSESQTRGVVQVELAGSGIVSVSAGLPGMSPTAVRTVENPYGTSVIFEVDFPEGVTVVLRTSVPVVEALWMQ